VARTTVKKGPPKSAFRRPGSSTVDTPVSSPTLPPQVLFGASQAAGTSTGRQGSPPQLLDATVAPSLPRPDEQSDPDEFVDDEQSNPDESSPSSEPSPDGAPSEVQSEESTESSLVRHYLRSLDRSVSVELFRIHFPKKNPDNFGMPKMAELLAPKTSMEEITATCKKLGVPYPKSPPPVVNPVMSDPESMVREPPFSSPSVAAPTPYTPVVETVTSDSEDTPESIAQEPPSPSVTVPSPYTSHDVPTEAPTSVQNHVLPSPPSVPNQDPSSEAPVELNYTEVQLDEFVVRRKAKKLRDYYNQEMRKVGKEPDPKAMHWSSDKLRKEIRNI